ncbi:MAG: phosphotransferase [Desulfobacteraceae bacterium]|jgi:protein-tyrosine phosphatase|nr:MAG: phosphotransferase [Desulfobacteraceae bacterium]
MIDLHSHILPGLDDGPETLEQSIEMARLYEKAGFTAVVATPHWIAGSRWAPDRDLICERVALLRQALSLQEMRLMIYPGMEIAMDGDLPDLMNTKHLIPLAEQSYVLLETPFQRLPAGWESLTAQLMEKGFRILLAHPERCRQLNEHPEIFEELIDAGIYLQVNMGAFTGEYGVSAENTAYYLADKRCIHCLATDAHDASHRSPARAPGAVRRIKKQIGENNLDLLFRLNPTRIIDGSPLASMEKPVPTKQRKIWGSR